MQNWPKFQHSYKKREQNNESEANVYETLNLCKYSEKNAIKKICYFWYCTLDKLSRDTTHNTETINISFGENCLNKKESSWAYSSSPFKADRSKNPLNDQKYLENFLKNN